MPVVLKKVQENKQELGLTANAKVVKTTRKVKVESKPVASANLTAVNKDDSYGKVFSAKPNSALLSQYIRVYQFNQRRGNAQTKTRGDVAGSGKKPWKQKGTGRSRVGSIRTPVWRHGGVSHGPVAKDWSLDLPKKAKAKAFMVTLSQKILDSQVFFLDKIELQEGRTKEVLSVTKAWNLDGNTLIVTANTNPNLQKGSANLKNIQVVDYHNLNTYQLLSYKNIVFEKEALDKIKEKYAKNQ